MAMDAPFPRGGLEEQVLLERTPSGVTKPVTSLGDVNSRPKESFQHLPFRFAR
jgi:hypothetical protein